MQSSIWTVGHIRQRDSELETCFLWRMKKTGPVGSSSGQREETKVSDGRSPSRTETLMEKNAWVKMDEDGLKGRRRAQKQTTDRRSRRPSCPISGHAPRDRLTKQGEKLAHTAIKPRRNLSQDETVRHCLRPSESS